jgi:hypothetical protein
LTGAESADRLSSETCRVCEDDQERRVLAREDAPGEEGSMHRSSVCRAAVACLWALALLPAGCATPGVEADTEPATRPAYPDWVRIVPEPTDEASYYVGAVALARDLESGIAAAEADAMAQVREGQRRHLVSLFDRAAADAGIETTSQERLALRTNIADEVTRELSPAASQMDVSYRECGHGSASTVCEVFLLIRLDHAERDRISDRVLAAVAEERQREGETNLAALIEWALKNR